MNFIMNHAPGVRSVARTIDQQSSAQLRMPLMLMIIMMMKTTMMMKIIMMIMMIFLIMQTIHKHVIERTKIAYIKHKFYTSKRICTTFQHSDSSSPMVCPTAKYHVAHKQVVYMG